MFHMQNPTEIVIHCSATRPNWWSEKTFGERVAEVRRWHVQDNGWKDVGYHYLIDRPGGVMPGRPLHQTGAHVMGHNRNKIGVCLFGGHGSAKTDRFEDNFTPQQERDLRTLIAQLKAKFPSIKRVSGHNEYANKACPGFDVPKWLAEVSDVAESVAPEPVVLSFGSKGERAELVQRALIQLGYDLGPAGADRDFGKRSTTAFAQWQADNGLFVTGAVTQAQLVKLKEQVEARKPARAPKLHKVTAQTADEFVMKRPDAAESPQQPPSKDREILIGLLSFLKEHLEA